MQYKKEIRILFFLILTGITVVILWLFNSDHVCNPFLKCLRIAIFGAPYQYFFLPLSSFLFSLIPFFFLKEQVYKTWRKFALFAIPVIAILIFLSPTRAPGDYITFGFDREVASMLFSVLFLVISWGIAVGGALKSKKA